MKQFKAEWHNKGEYSDIAVAKTIANIMTQHNALCDYLEKRERGGAKHTHSIKMEGETVVDTKTLKPLPNYVLKGTLGNETNPQVVTVPSLPHKPVETNAPLFKAGAVAVWGNGLKVGKYRLYAIGETEDGEVYVEFSKEGEKAREALLKLTDIH